MAQLFFHIKPKSLSVMSAAAVKTFTSIPQKRLNRLAQEKSPYLLQHATNPVNWYPWGDEAFTKAKGENKPIFLSVGYSTCHWCHVMERESFESQAIADYLNEHYVSVKVDREERPDVDKVYMSFIQATQGGGGWPMSVFLTPDLTPFMGGTYFPPKDNYGRPGFLTILTAIKEEWQKEHKKITEKVKPLMKALEESTVLSLSEESSLPAAGCIQRAADALDKSFDETHGGFGRQPKFPQPVMLDLLLRIYGRYPGSAMGSRALEMTLFTLNAMNNGGIHDHISQGFHRYSTDKFWHVPHFEKMLYDQAQLVSTYLDSYQITKDELMNEVSMDILTYVSRDLSDKDGGFYSAEDADSLPTPDDEEKKEGAFCVWTWDEVHSLLSESLPNSERKLADLFSLRYGVKKAGNVSPAQDPHGELKNKNVLIIRESIAKLAGEFSLEEDQIKYLLKKGRDILYEQRIARPSPHRDDKILTSWNGLMISGFARGYQVLGDLEYLERAEKAAEFIRTSLYNDETHMLLRNAYRDDEGILSVGKIEGFADDYSFMIKGLLDLYEACQSSKWLEWAYHLQLQQDKLFLDAVNGGYYTTSGLDKTILIRMKEDQDGAEPSANSVSAMNLLRLSSYLDNSQFRSQAEGIFKSFSNHMTKYPTALAGLVYAYICFLQRPKQIIIVGSKYSQDTQQLLETVHSFYIPNKILILHDPSQPSTFLTDSLPVLKDMTTIEGQPTVYICEDYKCAAPINNITSFKRAIDPKIKI
jgi:uncharacterized protein YyaL (SSP411 family)